MGTSFDFAAFIFILYDVCAAGDNVPGCLGKTEPVEKAQETQKREPDKNITSRTNTH